MSYVFTQEQLIEAHAYCRHNFDDVLAADYVGCFYCQKIYGPEILDEDNFVGDPEVDKRTVLCPHCGIDSVIPNGKPFGVDHNLLSQMHEYWFKLPEERRTRHTKPVDKEP